MPSPVVVFVFPASKQLRSCVKRWEEMGVQKLISEPPIEAFDEGILRWLSGLNVLNVDSVLRSPSLKMFGAKLWAVVAIDCLRVRCPAAN